MATQKYGPPLVGYALQISGTGHYKRNTFRDTQSTCLP